MRTAKIGTAVKPKTVGGRGITAAADEVIAVARIAPWCGWVIGPFGRVLVGQAVKNIPVVGEVRQQDPVPKRKYRAPPEIEVRGHRVLLEFIRVDLQDDAQLVQIAFARGRLACRFCPRQPRQQQRGQDGNDGNNDQKFDQRERGQAVSRSSGHAGSLALARMPVKLPFGLASSWRAGLRRLPLDSYPRGNEYSAKLNPAQHMKRILTGALLAVLLTTPLYLVADEASSLTGKWSTKKTND